MWREELTISDFDEILSDQAKNVIMSVYELNKSHNVGFRRKNKASLLYKYYNDMTKVFVNLNKIVRKQGSIFIVIGDNKTKAGGKDVFIKSGKILRETGEKLGWKTEQVIPITVTQENRRHNKNSITENEIIWFRKY